MSNYDRGLLATACLLLLATCAGRQAFGQSEADPTDSASEQPTQPAQPADQQPPLQQRKPADPRPLFLPPRTRGDQNEYPPDHWVQQLGDPGYLRRELATKKLIEAGPVAINDLVGVLPTADLETVERVLTVLREIAMTRPPNGDGGAWDELTRLATRAAGIRSARARAALAEIRVYRTSQAQQALLAEGVFVGFDDFVIGSSKETQMGVRIDGAWQGEAKSLHWLRWLDDVKFAQVSGNAVRRDVFEQLIQMPDLQTLAVVDATVEQATLEPLKSMTRIDRLEFRYVRLSPELCDFVVTLPLRKSLHLMGTGVAVDKAEAMSAQLPGLRLDHKQGGFLGVVCMDSFEICQIDRIVPGSAAATAGMIAGDVIVQIEDHEVGAFRDLQNAINEHLPGDEVKVHYLRGDTIQIVTLQLGKLNNR